VACQSGVQRPAATETAPDLVAGSSRYSTTGYFAAMFRCRRDPRSRRWVERGGGDSLTDPRAFLNLSVPLRLRLRAPLSIWARRAQPPGCSSAFTVAVLVVLSGRCGLPAGASVVARGPHSEPLSRRRRLTTWCRVRRLHVDPGPLAGQVAAIAFPRIPKSFVVASNGNSSSFPLLALSRFCALLRLRVS